MHLLRTSSRRSSQAGSAQGAGLPQEGLIARSYPICPSLLPSFSPTSFCGIHTPSPPFSLPSVISYFLNSLQVCTLGYCTFTPWGLERAGLGLQHSPPQAEVAEGIRYCQRSLSSSCSLSAARTPHISTAQKALSAPMENSQEIPTTTA